MHQHKSRRLPLSVVSNASGNCFAFSWKVTVTLRPNAVQLPRRYYWNCRFEEPSALVLGLHFRVPRIIHMEAKNQGTEIYIFENKHFVKKIRSSMRSKEGALSERVCVQTDRASLTRDKSIFRLYLYVLLVLIIPFFHPVSA